MGRTGLAAAVCILIVVAAGTSIAGSARRIGDTSSRGSSAGSPAFPDYFSSTFVPGQAIVSLRFDDGHETDWDLIRPLLRERGLHASFAVIYNTIGLEGSLSLSQIRQLEDEGNEIVCHSWTHGSEPASFAEFEHETAGAKEAMEALGFTITSFSIPGSWEEDNRSNYIAYDSSFFDTPADRLLRKHFYAYEGFVQDLVGGGPYRTLPVTGDVPFGFAHVTEGGIAQIDEAIARGAGIQLLWHSLNLGQADHQSVAQLTRIFDYVAAKVATGEVVVLTDTQQLYAVATPKAGADITLETSHDVVSWGGSATLTGTLTDGAEAFTAGQQVRLKRSNDGFIWTPLQVLDPSATFTYSVAVQPTRKTMYRLVFTGDATHSVATSPPVTVTPKVKLGTPAAPLTVRRGKRFTAYGNLVPRASAGSHSVKIRCYQKQSGAWKLKKTVAATNRDYATFSRYSTSFTLPARGNWKLTAYAAATSKYAATTSGAEFLQVK